MNPEERIEIPLIHNLRTCLEWRQGTWYRWWLDADTNEKLAFVALDPQPKPPVL